jgi:hypothetical protein
MYGVVRGVYRVLVGEPEGKKPLRRPRRRWEDNIKTDLQEIGCGVMDWIELAQDRGRRRKKYECRHEPSGSTKCREFLDNIKPVSFSRRTLLHGVSK